MNDVRLEHQDGFLPGGASFQRLIWLAAGCASLGGRGGRDRRRSRLRLASMEMPLSGLGAGLAGARLVHLTDLHCGPLVPAAFLRRCVEAVNALEPDFVALTGDFITVGSPRFARTVGEVLSGLRPRVASLAVLGNHDYGLWHPNGLGGVRGLGARVAEGLEAAGIIVLGNESRDFFRAGAGVQFAGTADLWSGRHDPDRAFENVRSGLPIIGLVHNPDAAPALAVRGAEWVLAGHTHGRRVRRTPLHDALFPVRCRRFLAGRYGLGAGRSLYVNTGLGNVRQGRPPRAPEVAVFTLTPAAPRPAEVARSLRPADLTV